MKKVLFALIYSIPLLAENPILPIQIYTFHISEYQIIPNQKHLSVALDGMGEESIINTLKTIGEVKLLSEKNINIMRGDPTFISDIKKAVPYEICVGKNCASLVAEEGYYLDMLPSYQNGTVVVDTRYRTSTIYAMEKVAGSNNPIPRTSSVSQTGQHTFGSLHTVVIGMNNFSANYNKVEHILIVTEKQL